MKPLADQFLDFCRSKLPGEKYHFSCTYECAIGQFGQHIGLLREGEEIGASGPILDVHYRFGRQLFQWPRTFGALADRLANSLEAK